MELEEYEYGNYYVFEFWASVVYFVRDGRWEMVGRDKFMDG
jgi:hypothetical protein